VIELPLNKAIIAVEVDDYTCAGCCFEKDNLCGQYSCTIRQDGKTVIFKIVDYPALPEENKLKG